MTHHAYMQWCARHHLSFGGCRVVAALLEYQRIMPSNHFTRYSMVEDLSGMTRRSINGIASELEGMGIAILSRGSMRLSDKTMQSLV